ncbi:MAG: glycosyltransferase family 2 protein [Pirellulaceae bacterium]
MTAQTQHHANRKKRLDIVVPLFNEQEVVRQLHSRLTRTLEQLPFASRIIYVDDGSSDRTIEKLVETMKGTDCVELIRLSRNFGQTAAIQAGLAAADADAVVVMDGDLQDPPELIMEMVDHWMMGYEVVIARRTDRDEGSWYRKKAFQAFHRFFRWISDFDIPANCGTFCLLDRSAAKSIAHMPEAHRFFQVCGLGSDLNKGLWIILDPSEQPAVPNKISRV